MQTKETPIEMLRRLRRLLHELQDQRHPDQCEMDELELEIERLEGVLC